MKNYSRNILMICALTFLLIAGFALLTAGKPTALPSMSALQAVNTLTGSDSHWAALWGIAGLIYLKVIWKLIHAPDIWGK